LQKERELKNILAEKEKENDQTEGQEDFNEEDDEEENPLDDAAEEDEEGYNQNGMDMLDDEDIEDPYMAQKFTEEEEDKDVEEEEEEEVD
jgi:hypothetical protein